MPWIWGGPCHNFEWEASTSATCNVKLICDSRSFGELYFQHWNFQLPCFKGKIICEIWMKTKHLIIHIHLKYEVGNPLSGCWAWQFLDQLYDPRKIQAEFDPTKELTHTGQYHMLSLMWFCIIWSYLIPLFFFAAESPAEAIKITTFGQSSISLNHNMILKPTKNNHLKNNHLQMFGHFGGQLPQAVATE